MITLNQSMKRKRIKKNKKTILNNNPQVKVIVLEVKTTSPRKPNSANRKIAVVQLKNKKTIKAYIPGENSSVQPLTKVLIRGGNTRDLPGVKYKIILGSVKGACSASYRCNKRSKYGVKKIKKIIK